MAEKTLEKSADTQETSLSELAEALGGSSRRARQQAAHVLSEAAAADPNEVLPFADALVDALNRPEAHTRWECLEALSSLIPVDSRACDKAIPGAELALFDEESGPLHLSALRFLCRLGATTENRSEKVWPLIDEAIQCWHGDLEFQDMLVAVNEFSQGKLSPSVKAALSERMSFDATNGKGALKRRAAQIVANLS